MKYSVKFFPEKRKGQANNLPIRLRVTYSLNKMEYYTGLRCNVFISKLKDKEMAKEEEEKYSQWDKKASRLKKNQIAPNGFTSQKINVELDKINNAVNDLFKLYDATNVMPSVDQLRNDLRVKLGKEAKEDRRAEQEVRKLSIWEYFSKYIIDAPISEGRKKHMRVTLKKMKAYRRDLTFDTLDSQYLTDFRKYLIHKCKLGSNTAISELKRLRAFLSYSRQKGWTSINPFESFTIGAETYGNPIYISKEERDHLYNAKIDDELLSDVRYRFVLQCLLGCRIGDFQKLTKSNIIDGWVEYIAGKTKDNKPKVARVPLNSKAKAILDRYDLPNNQLLPAMSEADYNENIKKVFKLDSVKLTRMVTIPDPKTRESIQKPLNELVSSHLARRTFVGNLFKQGVKDSVIASMSGHEQDSKSFARYYTVDPEDQKNAINLID